MEAGLPLRQPWMHQARSCMCQSCQRMRPGSNAHGSMTLMDPFNCALWVPGNGTKEGYSSMRTAENCCRLHTPVLSPLVCPACMIVVTFLCGDEFRVSMDRSMCGLGTGPQWAALFLDVLYLLQIPVHTNSRCNRCACCLRICVVHAALCLQ